MPLPCKAEDKANPLCSTSRTGKKGTRTYSTARTAELAKALPVHALCNTCRSLAILFVPSERASQLIAFAHHGTAVEPLHDSPREDTEGAGSAPPQSPPGEVGGGGRVQNHLSRRLEARTSFTDARRAESGATSSSSSSPLTGKILASREAASYCGELKLAYPTRSASSSSEARSARWS